MKYIFYLSICFILFSNCNVKYLKLPEDIEVDNLELRVLDYLKRSNYYLLLTENELRDTVYVVSYIKNKNNYTNPKENLKVLIQKDKYFTFKLMKVNERLVNGLPNIENIIVEKDTLWSNNVEFGIRLLNKKPQIYQSLNSEGIVFYNQ
ncbi:MAG: hypothetical protein LBI72_00585 [Flavobacteriaceae bacterium]|jgi:hypothetical protein|nr:hypothetical protein [Flavobacteriaceae bacterium]